MGVTWGLCMEEWPHTYLEFKISEEKLLGWCRHAVYRDRIDFSGTLLAVRDQEEDKGWSEQLQSTDIPFFTTLFPQLFSRNMAKHSKSAQALLSMAQH